MSNPFISEISAQSFNGLSFNHRLSRVTLVCGDNAAGKSAVGRAIRLLLLGYEPGDRIGRTAPAIYKALGDGVRPMRLQGNFDGTDVFRQWTPERNKKGGVSVGYNDSIPEALRGFPPMMADVSEYFRMTADQRIRHVFGLSPANKFDDEQLVREVRAISLGEKADVSELIEECAGEIEELGRDRDAVELDFVDRILAWFDKKWTEADRVVKGMGAADKANTLLTADTAPPPNVDKELEDARKALVAAQTGEQLEADRTQRVAALNTAKTRLTRFEEEYAELGDGAGDEKRKTEIGKLLAYEEPECKRDLQAAEQLLKQTDSDLYGLIDLRIREKMKLKLAVDVALTEHEKAENALTHQEDSITDATEAIKAAASCKCSECGQKLPAAKVKAIKEEATKALKTAKADLLEAKKQHAKTKAALENAAKEFDGFVVVEFRKIWAQVLAGTPIDPCAESIDRMAAAAQGTVAAIISLKAQVGAIPAAPDTRALLRELEEINTRISRRQAVPETRKQLQAAVAERQKSVDATPAPEKADLPGCRQRVAELEARQRARTRYDQDKLRSEQARTARAEAEVKLAVYKSVYKLAVKIQKETVCKAFDAICDETNRFAAGLLRHPLRHQDGEIGMGDHFYEHWTFSDMEQLLCYTGLAVALANHAPLKIAIVDRVECLHPKRRPEFFSNIQKLVSERVLDQAVLVMADEPPHGLDGGVWPEKMTIIECR